VPDCVRRRPVNRREASLANEDGIIWRTFACLIEDIAIVRLAGKVAISAGCSVISIPVMDAGAVTSRLGAGIVEFKEIVFDKILIPSRLARNLVGQLGGQVFNSQAPKRWPSRKPAVYHGGSIKTELRFEIGAAAPHVAYPSLRIGRRRGGREVVIPRLEGRVYCEPIDPRHDIGGRLIPLAKEFCGVPVVSVALKSIVAVLVKVRKNQGVSGGRGVVWIKRDVRLAYRHRDTLAHGISSRGKRDENSRE
jgi:hypothetical protein